jgi:hypothetical protein
MASKGCRLNNEAEGQPPDAGMPGGRSGCGIFG